MIIGVWDESIAVPVAALKVPVVDVFDWFASDRASQVTLGSRAVGPLAAEHFLQRGISHFGFMGELRGQFVQTRLSGFAEALKHAGQSPPLSHTLRDGNLEGSFDGIDADAELAKWLKKLPTPIGILAANDDAGCAF